MLIVVRSTKKQSKEYDIDSIGLLIVFTIEVIIVGNYRENVEITPTI